MTARAIETAAIERLEQRRSEAAAAPRDSWHERAAVQQRLPAWAALCFLVLAGLACWAPFLFGGAGDHYPFSNGDECRPCACSGELVLESCSVPTALRVRNLYLDGKGLRGIAPRAFQGLSMVRLDLSRNDITMLPGGVFDGLDDLGALDLSANGIETLGTGVFHSLSMLATLVLRDSPLAVLRAGVFSGLPELLNLFLDGSEELRVVEAGAFADTPRVANVWVGGSALNCTQLGLSSGVTCFDDVSCDVTRDGLHSIGDGNCDPGTELDRAACAWDGGDCR
jgi:hypothetical protein